MAIHEVFPYLRVKNAPSAIEFYKRAFGVTEKFRLTEPSGRVGRITDAAAVFPRARSRGTSHCGRPAPGLPESADSGQSDRR